MKAKFALAGPYLYLWVAIIVGFVPVMIWVAVPFAVRVYDKSFVLFIYECLWDRGIIPHVTMLIYTFSMLKLVLTVPRIRTEERAIVDLALALKDGMKAYFGLDTIETLMKDIQKRAEGKYRGTLTAQRMMSGLERLSNTKNLADAERLMEETARAYWERIDSEYGFIKLSASVIPVLGFLGTVYGISIAIVEMGKGISSFEKVIAALPQMTSSLGIAFDTTLVALFCSGVLLFVSHVVRAKEEKVLIASDQHLIGTFLPKIRIMGDEAAKATLQETVVRAISDEINLIELLREDLKGMVHSSELMKNLEAIRSSLVEIGMARNQVPEETRGLVEQLKDMNTRLQDVQELASSLEMFKDMELVFEGLQRNIDGLSENLEQLVNTLYELKPAISNMSSEIVHDINYALRRLLKAIVVANKLDHLTDYELEHYKNMDIDDLALFSLPGEKT